MSLDFLIGYDCDKDEFNFDFAYNWVLNDSYAIIHYNYDTRFCKIEATNEKYAMQAYKAYKNKDSQFKSYFPLKSDVSFEYTEWNNDGKKEKNKQKREQQQNLSLKQQNKSALKRKKYDYSDKNDDIKNRVKKATKIKNAYNDDDFENKKSNKYYTPKSEEIDEEKCQSLLINNKFWKRIANNSIIEVDDYQKKNINQKTNIRKLYGYTDEEIDNELNESNESNDENKIGELKSRKGMGDVLMIQSIIPTSQKLSAPDMLKKIQTSYENISKSQNDYVRISCDIQSQILDNLINNHLSKNVEDTRYFSNELSTYFSEVLTPFALICPNQSSINFEEGAFETLCRTLHLPAHAKNYMDKAYISYPTDVGNPLTDSSVYFRQKNNKLYKIGLSTKAGRNGIGAAASVRGLFPYIFDYNNTEINRNIFTSKSAEFNFNNYIPYLSIKSKELLLERSSNFNEIAILGIFGCLSPKHYLPYVDTLIKQYGLKDMVKINMGKNNRDETASKYYTLEKYFNDEMNFTNVIMSYLNYGAYDFAQVNTKQVSSIGESREIDFNNLLLEKYNLSDKKVNSLLNPKKLKGQHIQQDWHYEITFKYPAVFNGKVEMSFGYNNSTGPGRLTFHIL